VCASALELGQPPGPLGLEHPHRALDLVEVRREIVISQEPELLNPQLVRRRSQRAHAATLMNIRSSAL